MNVWRIYNVKKWFLISLASIILIWGIFVTAIIFYFQVRERFYIYCLILLGLYALFSLYYLFKQCLFRFFPFCKKEGKEIIGTLTWRIPSTGESASRPLAIIEMKQKKYVVGLIGMFDRSSKKKLKEGQRVTLYKIKGEPMAPLLVTK